LIEEALRYKTRLLSSVFHPSRAVSSRSLSHRASAPNASIHIHGVMRPTTTPSVSTSKSCRSIRRMCGSPTRA
jgi:hypothetical protein